MSLLAKCSACPVNPSACYKLNNLSPDNISLNRSLTTQVSTGRPRGHFLSILPLGQVIRFVFLDEKCQCFVRCLVLKDVDVSYDSYPLIVWHHAA